MNVKIMGENIELEDKKLINENGITLHEKEVISAYDALQYALMEGIEEINMSVTSYKIFDYLYQGKLRGSKLKKGESPKFKNRIFKEYMPKLLSLKSIFTDFKVNLIKKEK